MRKVMHQVGWALAPVGPVSNYSLTPCSHTWQKENSLPVIKATIIEIGAPGFIPEKCIASATLVAIIVHSVLWNHIGQLPSYHVAHQCWSCALTTSAQCIGIVHQLRSTALAASRLWHLISSSSLLWGLSLKHGPAWLTSLRTVQARAKTQPGQENVSLLSWWVPIKADRHWLLRNHVNVRCRP